MEQYKSMVDVINAMVDLFPFGDPMHEVYYYQTNGNVVEGLLKLASKPRVANRHDDHKGLYDLLSDEFLKSASDSSGDQFEEQRNIVLREAEVILHYSRL
jgi:hypothetical protein|tara:strand:- start:18 stop:317 length:300 start_codon:yes stop_codon:yes gene_type:complete